jgi:nitrate reductase gamma subunit
MTLAVYVIVYAAVLVFFIASVVRAVRYARLPLHLRWELYPVPHEEPVRVKHGGSYFETVDWWENPTHFNWWGEVKFMTPEILFLKGLWEFNRSLWFRSFPFHFGLYLVLATIGLLIAGALIGTAALHWCYTLTGIAGAALTVAGALGLLVRRLTDPNLKNYTAPGDIFNLVFFLVVFGLLAAGYLTAGAGFPGMLALVEGLLTCNVSVNIPPALAAGLALGALLAAYIPLTHMSHFIAKYFTYHSIRWDDAPNRGNPRLARRIAGNLAYRPAWAASHIGADGKKTWAEIATANPTSGTKK